MNRKEVPELLDLVQNTLGQWIRYRQFFIKGYGEEPISPDDEVEFLETASSLSQNLRKMGQRMDEKRMPTRKKEMSAQLKQAISITHFRNLPNPDKEAFYRQWHVSLMYLSRTVGALKFINEGYVPRATAKKGGRKAKGGGKGMKKILVVLIVLALVGGGGYFLLGFFGIL